MTESITEQTEQPINPTRYQCRHIHADGHRCGSPALRRQTFCYYHHTTRKPIPRGDLRQRYAEQSHSAPFDLPAPEDRTSIQLAIAEILRRIAAQQIDAKRAGLLLYGLQTAALNLPPHPRQAPEEAPKPQQTIEEIVEDEVYGPLAPEAEFNATPAARKSLDVILMEQWAKDKEEWEARKPDTMPNYVWDDEQENWVLPTPPPTPDPTDQPSTSPVHPETNQQTAILPELQAVAHPGGCPMITRKGSKDAIEGLSWGRLSTPPSTTHPTQDPTEKGRCLSLSRFYSSYPSYALLHGLPTTTARVPPLTSQSHPTRILRDNTPYVCAETSPALSHARRVGTARSHMARMAAQP